MKKTKYVYFSSLTKLSEEEIYQEFSTSKTGLTSSEASNRLNKFGSNVIKSHEVGVIDLLARQLKSPFIYLLLGASLLAFLLREYLDSFMIVLFVSINTALGFVQEYKSNEIAKYLKKFVNPKSEVIRDNNHETIDSQNIVVGDLIEVKAGDILQADIRFIDTVDLTVDETILTGESVSVIKDSKALKFEAHEIYEAENIGFSGTTVKTGRGRGIVIAIGQKTIFGEIGELTLEIHHTSSFEKGLTKFSKFILQLVILTLILLFSFNIIIKGQSADIPELLLFSIALAVSVIPEALPVVTTFSLSRGALKLSNKHVVVKRLSAIEDLGSIEILCADKTGTITENKLKVEAFFPGSKDICLEYAFYAASTLVRPKEEQDSFDQAIEFESKNLKFSKTVLDSMPFDPIHKRNIALVKGKLNNKLIVRGAPEEILNHVKAMPIGFQKWLSEQGIQGKRVLAIAAKPTNKKNLKGVSYLTQDLTFVGAIAFTDPLKPTTALAIKKARELGVRVMIITGDSPEVAGYIGKKIGLLTNPSDVVVGRDVARFSDVDLFEATERTNVFARMNPQQKFRVIQSLAKNHEVGFLGEGINDAPALQAANVGIVVAHASDISRSAADIILLNKSLLVIIEGIEEGRRVFANTIKYIRATLTSNFGNFYAVAIASLIIDFLPMLPIQLLLVNLLSDFPMISVATDTVDASELDKPTSYQVKDIVIFATILGIVSTIFDFIFFGLFYRISPEVLHTNWFIGSILTEIFLVFSVRTKYPFYKSLKPSRELLFLSLTGVAMTILIPFTAIGREVFRFVAPSPMHISIILLIAIIYFGFSETIKVLFYQKSNNRV